MPDRPAPPRPPDAAPPDAGDAATRSLADALRLSFGVLKLAMALAVVVFLLRGFFIVKEGTVALKKRFGEYVTDAAGAVREYREGGIYYAVPLVESVEVVELRTETVDLDEAFYPAGLVEGRPAAADRLRPGVDGYAITGDMNILHTRCKIEYKVTDPYLFRTTFQDRALDRVNPQTGKAIRRSGPEQYLREVFRNAVVRVTAGIPIDDALKNRAYQSRVAELARAELARRPCGIRIREVSFDDQTPPQETKAAFKAVTEAKSDMSGRISEAEGERREAVNRARGRAAVVLKEAKVYASDVVSAARSDATKMRDLLARFPDDPEGLQVYLDLTHREELARILDGVRINVLRPGQTWYLAAPPAAELPGPGTTD